MTYYVAIWAVGIIFVPDCERHCCIDDSLFKYCNNPKLIKLWEKSELFVGVFELIDKLQSLSLWLLHEYIYAYIYIYTRNHIHMEWSE